MLYSLPTHTHHLSGQDDGSVVGVLVWITFPVNRGLKSILQPTERMRDPEQNIKQDLMTRHEVISVTAKVRTVAVHLFIFMGFPSSSVKTHMFRTLTF